MVAKKEEREKVGSFCQTALQGNKLSVVNLPILLKCIEHSLDVGRFPLQNENFRTLPAFLFTMQMHIDASLKLMLQACHNLLGFLVVGSDENATHLAGNSLLLFLFSDQSPYRGSDQLRFSSVPEFLHHDLHFVEKVLIDGETDYCQVDSRRMDDY
jgi:hypothetical protein